MAGAGNLVNEIEAAGRQPSRFVINAQAEDSPIQTPKRAQGTSERTDTTIRCLSQDSKPRPLFLAAGVTRGVITDSRSASSVHFIRLRYLPSRVSTTIRSPIPMCGGTWSLRPVS